jgi:hypothetical protein
MPTIRNVFVSHIFEDDASVQDFKRLLEQHGYEVRDSSIVKDKANQAKDPDYIKSKILGPRIDWAGVLVVLVSPNTCESQWVNWEIEYAHQHDKRIVGVWLQGAQDSDLPENLDKYGDAMVGWQGGGVIDAIEGKDKWVTPSGAPRAVRDIDRHKC